MTTTRVIGCRNPLIAVAILATTILLSLLPAQSLAASAYPLRTTNLRTVVVDPARGNDRNAGTRKKPLRTITAAWQSIPQNQPLTRGVRILLKPGNYKASQMPNYWENRQGTATAPIIIQSAQGASTVRLSNMNVFNVDHLALVDVRLESPNDVFHCEQCTYLLLRRSVFSGIGDPTKGQGPQEGIKINQSSHVFVEDSDISGGQDNALDFVAVHGGHIWRNSISRAQDWCGYAKGGSNDILVEANTFFQCGTGGFTAGQGTGLEFMDAPYIQYEAYDIAVINNVAHHTYGAGFGVNGGANVLVAHNTTWRTGTRSHILEASFGDRSCDGDVTACTSRISAGGWGPTRPVENPVYIPNRDVSIVGNLVANPSNASSPDEQFFVPSPRPAGEGTSLGATVSADTGLVIAGNAISNGQSELPLGFDDDSQGCTVSNPTCNAALVRSANSIGVGDTTMRNPDASDFTPLTSHSRISTTPAFTMPTFNASGLSGIPTPKYVSRSMPRPADRAGRSRPSSGGLPGALHGASLTSTLKVGVRGSGKVRWINGPGFSCVRARCATAAERFVWVRLQASATSGRKFVGWRGACSGSNATCFVRMDKARSTLAVFR